MRRTSAGDSIFAGTRLRIHFVDALFPGKQQPTPSTSFAKYVFPNRLRVS